MARIASLAATKRTAIVLINQARQKIGIVFGDPTTTPGGTAHKFQASARLQLWAGKAVETAGEVSGIHTTIKCVKNKLAIPFHKARVRLMFETGWDDRWSTIEHAKELELIPASAKVGAVTLELARQKLGWTK
jgi:recombination protein RecA